MEELLVELEEDDETMMSGSDDEFEDIGHPEKERDEWGAIDCDLHPTFTIPSFPTHEDPGTSPPLPSPPTLHQPMSEGSTPPAPSSTPSSPSHTNTSDIPGRWSTALSPIDIAPFVQAVGPTVAVPLCELDVFNLFFTDDISFIVEQTNLYAQQVLGEKYRDWAAVIVEDLRAYFGFMVLMGIVHLPALDNYCSRAAAASNNICPRSQSNVA